MPLVHRSKKASSDAEIKISSYHGYLYCGECTINPYNEKALTYGYIAYNLGVMLAHLAEHQKAGEKLSANLTKNLFEHEKQYFPEGGSRGGYFTMGYLLPPHWERLLTPFEPTHY